MHWVKDSAAAVKMRPKIPELTSHQTMLWTMNAPHRSMGETQAGSLRQTGSVSGHKTAILYRRMSGANKSYLRRFAGLCALTVKTASRTAAGEPPTGPRQANDIGDSVRGEQSSRRRQNKRALDFQRGTVQITAGLRVVQRSGLFLFTKIMKGRLWGKTRADLYAFYDFWHLFRIYLCMLCCLKGGEVFRQDYCDGLNSSSLRTADVFTLYN